MHFLLTGGSGLVGSALVEAIQQAGHTFTPLSHRQWDVQKEVAPASLFLEDKRIDVVVHLAGAPIAEGRWSAARKEEILRTRELGTRNLVQTLRSLSLERRPKALVSASAIGYYGLDPQGMMSEDSPAGRDFLAQVCVAWEREAREAQDLGIRTVQGRIGIVLAREGGALAQLLPLFRAGLGGPQGDGKQWMSWIHRTDVVQAILHCALNPSVTGPVNWVSPHPVRNEEFARTLGRALKRPALLRAPALALRLALGEMAQIVLQGQKVSSAKLQSSGFGFRFPELEHALIDLL